ncbi:uncharacterized protein LOC113758820 isoform X2 [Coffea eugenioides]|uniref:uncharacterized protein LOC113758820 isoform X2 n=1 Tax=Coffea eugenioides TaxID=49369 RepID=UPI000F609628|nr:uncharacterized protein LOC113758820 isoform X2 [Coffea eugenioides]
MVETRRSSSTSKRPLPSPSSPLPKGKRSKAGEASSSTNDSSGEVGIDAAKESGRESREQEVRSADLTDADNLKLSDGEVPEKLPEGRLESDSVIDLEKTKSIGKVLNRGKKRQMKSKAAAAWGKLLSQFSQNRHVVISNSTFTVGQDRQSDLWVGDPSVSKSLCRLRHISTERGCPVTLLEITGKKGSVQVNGKIYPKNSTVPLSGGDEVVFSSSGKHAYVSLH